MVGVGVGGDGQQFEEVVRVALQVPGEGREGLRNEVLLQQFAAVELLRVIANTPHKLITIIYLWIEHKLQLYIQVII